MKRGVAVAVFMKSGTTSPINIHSPYKNASQPSETGLFMLNYGQNNP